MTSDEIIRMAREWLPKAYRDGDVGDEPKFTRHNMEVAFAAGAAAEREACARVCEEQGKGRKALEHYAALTYSGSAHDCAAAIRARGQA